MRLASLFRLGNPAPVTGRALGDRARDSGDKASAVKFYREHLAEEPGDFAIWVQLGHCLKDQGELNLAADAYGAAFDLKPRDADLLLNLGHLSKLRGDMVRAAQYYIDSDLVDGNSDARAELRSADIAPLIETARDILGDLSTARIPFATNDKDANDGVWQAIVSHWEDLVEKDPDDEGAQAKLRTALIKLAESLSLAGRNEEVEAALLKASALTSDDAVDLLDLGHLFRLAGYFQEAANHYRRSYAINRNPDARAELEAERMAGYVVAAEKLVKRGPPVLVPQDNPLRKTVEIGSIDGQRDWRISGWAVDPDNPDEPATVGFFVKGRLVGTITADRFRGDVETFDIGCPVAGFEGEIDLDFSEGKSFEVHARLMSSGRELHRSPFSVAPPVEYGGWLARSHRLSDDALAITARNMDRQVEGMTLSLIMPVYATKPEWLRQSIRSVIDQWCGNWELICVDDCSPDQSTRDIVLDFAADDRRVKLIALEQNLGISKAINAGIEASTGDYIGFVDHDDFLEPDAVFRMLDAARTAGSDLLYSDEITTPEDIGRIESLAARPAFSHDYYISHPYFVHFVCVRAELAKRVRYDDELKISADVDFVLRVIEQADVVTHVPAVLYRWRTHKTSTGHTRKQQVTDTMLGVLNAHLDRMGMDGKVVEGPDFNSYRVDYADDHGKILVIIPTKNRHDLVKVCVESLLATSNPDEIDMVIVDHDSTDPKSIAYFKSLSGIATVLPYSGPFNFAAINNFAFEKAWRDQPYVMFLNNDIEAIEPGWVEHMRGLARRSDVGIVGAALLYPDDRYQHGGVVMGLGALVDHAHKLRPYRWPNGARYPGYKSSLISTREYSAVTAACMMMRSELFESIGGYDEAFEVGFNDTDICLRVGSLGYKILYDAHAVLYHHESATRQSTQHMTHPDDARRLGARWADILMHGDPFYSPLLVQAPGVDHTGGTLNEWHYPPRSRRVHPQLKPAEQVRPDVLGEGIPRYASTGH